MRVSTSSRQAWLVTLVATLAFLLSAATPVLGKGTKEPPKPMAKASVIVALGFGHNVEGRPRPAMAQRVLAAVDAWNKKKAPFLLFCGGYTSGHVAEAEEMKIMATALGVPEKAILLERASMSTQQNAKYAAPILEARRMKSAFLVTHQDHLPRATKSFKKLTKLKNIAGIAADEFTPLVPALAYSAELPGSSQVQAVVIHGRTLGLKPESEGIGVTGEQAELARCMADLMNRGYRELPFLVWHPAAGIGHVTRAEAIAIASVVFGASLGNVILAPARRFSEAGETPGVAVLCLARGWTKVLAVLPSGRADDVEEVRTYYQSQGIEATVVSLGSAPAKGVEKRSK